MTEASDLEPEGFETERRPGAVRAWLMAIRPATLPAAVAPVVVGTAMAGWQSAMRPVAAIAALVGAVLIQIATNLANDYFDARRGTDTDDRIGPTRVVHAGILEASAVWRATLGVLGVATIVGAYLVWVGGLPILLLGLLSLGCAVAYTGGPFPLAYHGLGDVFVLVFFGLAAVGGTFWVQALEWRWDLLLAGAGVGALTTAILVVNNLRDIETDRRAGKRTLAVRIGRTWTAGEYVALVVLAALVPPLGVVWAGWPAWTLLALPGMGPAVRSIDAMVNHHDPRELRPLLGTTAQGLTWYSGLMATGFLIGSIPSTAL